MAVKWIFLWMGPGLSKVEVIHCLVRGRRTPENRPRCFRAECWLELEKIYGKVLEWRSSERRAAENYIIQYCINKISYYIDKTEVRMRNLSLGFVVLDINN